VTLEPKQETEQHKQLHTPLQAPPIQQQRPIKKLIYAYC